MSHVCTVNNHDYETDNLYTWCTNCGNYGINGALRRALVDECIEPKDVVLCFDIGCNGNGSDKIDGYRVHGLHGRVLPLAAGIALANSRIPVIASAGDGATLGEGINHFIHSIRSNFNMTFILHNNANYGLTTGQASATTPVDTPMNSSPDGVIAEPINVSQLVLSLNPSFYARAYSGNIKQMTSLMRAAINHNGFALIEILQDCPTYSDKYSHDWYLKRIYSVDEISSYDRSDIDLAKSVSSDLTNRIATGLIYYNKNSTDFLSKVANRKGIETELVDEVKNYEIEEYLQQFR